MRRSTCGTVAPPVIASIRLFTRDIRAISDLEEKYVIRDWPLFINSSIILGGVVSEAPSAAVCVRLTAVQVVLFFLHSFVEIHLKLAWISMVGAMLMLVRELAIAPPLYARARFLMLCPPPADCG